MTTRRGRIAEPLALLAGATLALGCLTALAPARLAGPPPVAPVPSLPPLAQKALAGGFAPALADIYWIRAGAAAGGSLDGAAADSLFDLLDRVTVLDPRFEAPYHLGALLLSVAADRPDLSDRLLLRAQERFPEVWAFPFYLGFNAFYHRTDFDTAAVHMDRAARLPGAPPYLAALARRFRDQDHNAEAAEELVGRLLRVTRDPAIRARLEERMKTLQARP
jgi:hypothetical protein